MDNPRNAESLTSVILQIATFWTPDTLMFQTTTERQTIGSQTRESMLSPTKAQEDSLQLDGAGQHVDFLHAISTKTIIHFSKHQLLIFIQISLSWPMIEKQSSLERSTDYFAEPRTTNFIEVLQANGLVPQQITEVSIKCYGYGYFPNYKNVIKTNLYAFIKECFEKLPNLTIFKLIFNGFDIANGYLTSILNILKTQLDKAASVLSVIWLHTNHLTECTHEDFTKMLEFIEVGGRMMSREEISIQITHWTFDRPINFKEMEGYLFQFVENCNLGMHFKKFKFELSSWYLKTEEAYEFLKSGLDCKMILEKLLIGNNVARNLAEKFLLESERMTYEEFTNCRSQTEKEIKKLINRSLNQEIMYYRIKDFQEKIARMVEGLLNILTEVQDFTIDLRNWNSIFKMHELNTVLQSKSGSRNQFSMIHKNNTMSQIARLQKQGNESPVLRTTYLV